MTNYTITNDLFVVNSDNVVCGGPYKNEESAKRRVRNLRQKDADAINGKPAETPNATTVAALIEAEEMSRDDHPRGPRPIDVEQGEVEREDNAYCAVCDSNHGHRLECATLNVRGDVLKLAASSAYGKSASLAGLVSNAKASTFTPSPFGTMQAGVYPAISKRERRKRWNHA
jgi:hypothetical protein